MDAVGRVGSWLGIVLGWVGGVVQLHYMYLSNNGGPRPKEHSQAGAGAVLGARVAAGAVLGARVATGWRNRVRVRTCGLRDMPGNGGGALVARRPEWRKSDLSLNTFKVSFSLFSRTVFPLLTV